ncbi:hypothetical protein [Pengzhenrongella phosphoraccumulans]|uniref:hypothetical protein n=1 Tax=Pengzhenrongella phosphoraccumulans TaxID=3114394 RepID=UPI00388DEB69
MAETPLEASLAGGVLSEADGEALSAGAAVSVAAGSGVDSPAGSAPEQAARQSAAPQPNDHTIQFVLFRVTT